MIAAKRRAIDRLLRGQMLVQSTKKLLGTFKGNSSGSETLWSRLWTR
jgi:hypothetical protein